MIRTFLVLALPLVISAASSNAGAGVDVDDVDFKAKAVIASINQFHGNRRKMLNNAFRDLAISDQCKTESDQVAKEVEVPTLSTDNPEVPDICVFTGTSTKTCDATDFFDADFHASCKEAGQEIIVTLTMSFTFFEITSTTIYNNVSLCIGASCDGEEFVKYLQEPLDATNTPLASTNFEFVRAESGAQSTRMHYGAVAASALAMAGVTFLN